MGDLMAINFGNAPCVLHDVKLKECGCPIIMASEDWVSQRDQEFFRRLGRLYGQARERAVFSMISGETPKFVDRVPRRRRRRS